MSSEDDKKMLTVYVMGDDDVHVGMTGRVEAPIALVIPRANLGIGLPIPIAKLLHDALCGSLAIIEDEEQDASTDIPKNLLNYKGN